jgi:hypothetical protein
MRFQWTAAAVAAACALGGVQAFVTPSVAPCKVMEKTWVDS